MWTLHYYANRFYSTHRQRIHRGNPKASLELWIVLNFHLTTGKLNLYSRIVSRSYSLCVRYTYIDFLTDSSHGMIFVIAYRTLLNTVFHNRCQITPMSATPLFTTYKLYLHSTTFRVLPKPSTHSSLQYVVFLSAEIPGGKWSWFVPGDIDESDSLKRKSRETDQNRGNFWKKNIFF